MKKLIEQYKLVIIECERRAKAFDKQKDYGMAAQLKTEADTLRGVIKDLSHANR